MSRGWSVVIPVKGDAAAKSRLQVDDGLRSALAVAFAIDTVSAALGSSRVGEVIVVGPSSLDEAFRGSGARRIDDPPERRPGESRLNAAIREGLRRVHDGRRGSAVLLGDLPRLRPDELTSALEAAASPRAFVPDAAGTGTVLIMARPGVPHLPSFGIGSAALHRAAGYLPIAVAAGSGLRRDVDTVEDLGSAAADRTLGPATRQALAAGGTRGARTGSLGS